MPSATHESDTEMRDAPADVAAAQSTSEDGPQDPFIRDDSQRIRVV